jgi:phosphopantothenoylcysteine decarboxylase/phosphopantothenate--cysteine ligase
MQLATAAATWGNAYDVGFEDLFLAKRSSADWADVMLIAPATAETIAQLSGGHAGTPLLATALACRAPVFIAPAMNVAMWENPATRNNLKILADRSVTVIAPESGHLACGWNAAGRLAEVAVIVNTVLTAQAPGVLARDIPRPIGLGADLTGLRAVVTLGPTREPIDPVRFLSNHSSGKMGKALVAVGERFGVRVHAVHGPVNVDLSEATATTQIETALELEGAVHQAVFAPDKSVDVVIMAAAVADYRIASPSNLKLKRQEADLSLTLIPNPDIVKGVVAKRGRDARPLIVGFAVETLEGEALTEQLVRKAEGKGVDILIGNRGEEAFNQDSNRIWIVQRGCVTGPFSGTKDELAVRIWAAIADRLKDEGK